MSDTAVIELDIDEMSIDDTKTILTNIAPIPLEDNLFVELSSDFDPIFQNIRIYGTIEEPYFIANDVKKLLNISKINYTRDFKEGLHIVYLEVDTGQGLGLRKNIAFTEFGLYVALMKSTVPLAEKFQNFVCVVMKRLRLRGKVTMQEALADYNKLKIYVKNLEDQVTEEHNKAAHYETKSANLTYSLSSVVEQKAKLEIKCENVQNKDFNNLEERFKRVFKYYGKEVILSIVDPPEHLKDYHDYDINSITPWDYDELLRDDTYIWTLSAKELNGTDAVPVTKIYIHKLDKVERIIDFMIARECGVKTNKGLNYAKYFEATIENIEEFIDDANKEFEKKYMTPIPADSTS